MIDRDHPEFVDAWDVYRDTDGNPVTITEQQMWAIVRAIRVVQNVRTVEGSQLLHEGAGFLTNAEKSRLLGRMLLEGKPPTKTKPPFSWGAPEWKLLPDGDPFDE